MRDVIGVLWRARLRRQWRAHVVIVLLLAIGAGMGLACLAGARRTASAFGRITEVSGQPDVNSGHGMSPADAVEIADGFDGVADQHTVVGFVGRVQGLDPTLLQYFIGPWEEPLAHSRPHLLAGRYPRPDDPAEVLVSGQGARLAGLQPGDELTMEIVTSDFSSTVERHLVVAGTAANTFEVAADAAQNRGALYFTPAFTRANADELQAWSATSLIAEEGVDEGALVSQVLAAGWTPDEVFSTTYARVQDAVRPLTTTLAALGALVLLTTLVVVGQALGRQAEAERNRERRILSAVGVTPGQARAVDVLTALTVAIPGALLAVVVAIGASPRFPVGSVRPFDPERGVDVDATVLAVGALGVVLLLLLGDRFVARRFGRVERGVPPLRITALASSYPPVASGLRLAAGGTTTQRRRFAATVFFTATALGLVIGGIAFVSALDRLEEEPRRYGVGWDLTARNAYGEIESDELVQRVDGDPDIDGVTGATLHPMLLDDDITVPGLALLAITAEQWPTLTDGVVPAGPGQILVGEDVLELLDASIGDTVTMASPFGGGDVLDVTIVGTAVFPSVELAGVNPTRLGNGVALTWEDHLALQDESLGPDLLPDIVFFDLADGVDPQAVIDKFPDGMPESTGISETEWLPSLAPGEVRETSRATGLIWTVVALLSLTVLATIGHTLAATVRQRRGDYAVLKALGFTRSQVLSAVTWQSLLTVAAALVVAIPLGAALGRSTWRLFADIIGVIDTPVLPVGAMLGAVVGSLVVAALVAVAPGRRAGRTPAARVLSGE